MENTEEQLVILLKRYMEKLDGLLATVVCDRDGFLMASEGADEDDSLIGVITALLDKYIDRIKSEFGTKGDFFNILEIEDHKFAYCSRGSNSILTSMATPDTSDIALKVYSEHIAGKNELILQGQDHVSLDIPQIIDVLSKTRSGKLPEGEYNTKVILTGDYKVGKTSLVDRFVNDKFEESYLATIGLDISKKTEEITDNTTMNFIIWDIGGQIKQMAPYRSRFYDGANAAFIVIDRTRPGNLNSINAWYEDIKKSVPKDIPMVIVGNKSDLVDDIVITEEEIEEIAEKYGFHHITTSAKTGENVNDAFLYIGLKFLEKV
ncbi:MAG: GTP-binding protein [Promethearchaeia archaeon]